MYLTRYACVSLCAAALVLSPAAGACDPQQRDSAPDSPAPSPAAWAPAAGPPPVAGLGTAAPGQALESARGGSDAPATSASLHGTVSGNSATSVNTGSNVIAASSFANMTGIPIVIQNSGANVLIQNSTIINLQLK